PPSSSTSTCASAPRAWTSSSTPARCCPREPSAPEPTPAVLSLPPPVHDPDEVREAADAILADPRYDVPPEPLPERILGWFAEQIGEVLGSVVGSGAGAVIAWAVVLAAIGFVVYLIVRYGRVGRIELPARPRASTMVELSRSPAEWRARAPAPPARGRRAGGRRGRPPRAGGAPLRPRAP